MPYRCVPAEGGPGEWSLPLSASRAPPPRRRWRRPVRRS